MDYWSVSNSFMWNIESLVKYPTIKVVRFLQALGRHRHHNTTHTMAISKNFKQLFLFPLFDHFEFKIKMIKSEDNYVF